MDTEGAAKVLEAVIAEGSEAFTKRGGVGASTTG